MYQCMRNGEVLMKRVKNILLTLFLIICMAACSASEAGSESVQTISMPDLTGDSMVNAVEKLEKLGFTEIAQNVYRKN